MRIFIGPELRVYFSFLLLLEIFSFPQTGFQSAWSKDLKSKSEVVRMESDVKAMIRDGDWDALASIDRLSDKKSVLPDLFAASRSPDADIRYLAANGLEEINDPSVTDAFVRLLADPVEKVRLVSLRGLQSRTEKRIVPSLLPHLKNSDAYVRGEIALVLGKFGDAAVLQGIKNAVEKEKVPETRKKMQLASARLGDASEREKICEQLTMKNPDSVLQGVRDLDYIADPRLARHLLPAFGNTTNVYTLGIPDDPKGPFARICDIAVVTASHLLGSSFPIQINGRENFPDNEIESAKKFISGLSEAGR
jgi:hypothetical protein